MQRSRGPPAEACRNDARSPPPDLPDRHRFGRLPPEARDFFASARLRIDCKRRGIVRLDVGPEAVAATFLPGRLRKSRGKSQARSLQRDGDRVVHAGRRDEDPFSRVEEFLDLLDG